MRWLHKRKLHPIQPEIVAAHREALAAKKETAERSPLFKELAENMLHRHRANGFGEKLEKTYQGKGLL